MFLSITLSWHLDTNRQYLIKSVVQLNASRSMLPNALQLLSSKPAEMIENLSSSLMSIERLQRTVADMSIHNRMMVSKSDFDQLQAINLYLSTWSADVSHYASESFDRVTQSDTVQGADFLRIQLTRLPHKFDDLNRIIIKAETNINLLANVCHLVSLIILLLLSCYLLSSTGLAVSIINFFSTSKKQNRGNNSTRQVSADGSSRIYSRKTDSKLNQDSPDMQVTHHVLTRLLEEPGSIEPYLLLLKNIEGMIGATSSAIFTSSTASNELCLLASTAPSSTDWPENISREIMISFATDSSCPVKISDVSDPSVEYIYIKFPHGKSRHGLLIIKVDCGFKLNTQIEVALQAYSEQLANIVHSASLAQLNLRNAQYEERSAIARELHDSLAQSLSYLKIQSSRLQNIVIADNSLNVSNMQTNDKTLEIDDVIQDMRMNLNVAYRHLRELISTFRISTRGKSFATALDDSVHEFSNRSIVSIHVDNRLSAGMLTVAEEIQLLHIIREALSNIIRHSHATCANIAVHYKSPDQVSVTVEDDGIGLPATFSSDQHHGIIIMQERTHALNGDMLLEKRSIGGTRLSINFKASHPV